MQMPLSRDRGKSDKRSKKKRGTAVAKKKETAKLQDCKTCGAYVAKPRKHAKWHKRPSGRPVSGPPGPMGPKGDKGDMAPPPPDMSATVEKFVTEMRKKFGSLE